MHVAGHDEGLPLEHREHLGGRGENGGLLVVPQGGGVVEVVPRGAPVLEVPHGGPWGAGGELEEARK